MAAGKQTILGAGGAIGIPLASALREYAADVRLAARHPRRVNPQDELWPADLTDSAQVDKAVAGSDVAYLVAGLKYSLRAWQSLWPRVMRAVLDACARHGTRLVFFDNMYLYGLASLGRMTEESPVRPPSRKGEVRRQVADMLLEDAAAGKLRALIARAPDFYGPGIANSVFNSMVIDNLRKGRKPMWLVDADRKHSFIFTPDAARATAMLGNTEDAFGQVWHLPTDPETLTGRQLAALAASALRGPEGITVLRPWQLRLLGIFIPVMREMPEMLYQYDRDYVFDSGKFERRFGFRATPYAEGIRQVAATATATAAT